MMATEPSSRSDFPKDPWSHRRVEPRGLAILWSTYLFFLTITIFAGTPMLAGASPETSRLKARLMLAAVAIGITVLWPLLRLSQTRPVRGRPGGGMRDAGMLADWVVLMAPAQAVIWPQGTALLAGWPIDVVGCASAWIAAWGLLVGALLAIAMRPAPPHGPSERRDSEWHRATWMLGFVALTTLGLVGVALDPALAVSSDDSPRRFLASWMFSPVTGVFEITRDRAWTGVPAAIVAGHWWSAAAVAALSIPVWIWAWIDAGPQPSRPSRDA